MHGIATGSDDRDEMGVCIEGPASAIGLERFEQAIYRSAAVREGRDDARSQAGDLDRVVYSLRKFAGLALKGNPSVQSLLFAPEPIVATEAGLQLRESAERFASTRVVRAFLGYMDEQLARLEGRRGQKGVKRPELIEQYGYDTKYAGHVIRLGLQGRTFARTGRIPIPLPERERCAVLAIRRGEVDEQTVRTRAGELIGELETLLRENPFGLPDRPDYAWANDWLVRVHLEAWGR